MGVTNERRLLPVDEQDFQQIIETNKAYVDKTALIYELTHKQKYNFLSRPRRFGKSLLTSTLKSYFLGKSELFKNLAIEKLEKEWRQHEVFHFDFSGGDFRSGDKKVVHSRIRETLIPIEEKYKIELDPEDDYSARFSKAVKAACEKSGNRVVILIDEYDKPLLQHFESGKDEPSEVKNELRGLYATLKPLTPYIRFLFITGVSKFSGMSLFSDLNNLYDISFDEPYSAICGFTQDELVNGFPVEIDELAKKQGLTYQQTLDKLKDYYDGYDFVGAGVKVYNPFSTLNCLTRSAFDEYWFETATPSLLIEKIKNTTYDVKKLENKINISLKTITGYKPTSKAIIPLLYQTGYLTIKQIDEYGDLILGYPNKEVQRGFEGSLLDYFGDNLGSDSLSDVLKNSLKEEDLGSFFKNLDLLFAETPYFVNTGKEKDFQIIFFMCIRGAFGLGADVKELIKTEEPSPKGRADLLLKMENKVYIFELKVVKKHDKNSVKAKLNEALDQIDIQKYATRFEKEKARVIKVAVVFSSDDKNVVAWQEAGESPCFLD